MNPTARHRPARRAAALALLLASATGPALAEQESLIPAEIANAIFHGTEYGEVTLADGVWEGEPWVEGGASRPRVGLARDFLVRGDVDGDGADEALVVVWQSSGGSGTFNYVALVDELEGAWRNTATIALGDRVKVTGATMAPGRIEVEVIEHDEDDPACCPTRQATRRYDAELNPLPDTESESR